MAAAPDELHEFPPPTLAPPELLECASELGRKHSECFWFWHSNARVRRLEDVRLVMEHLREYGDRRAWWEAQELHMTYPLPAICWAATGKDPGFSPLSLLKRMKRFARVSPTELDKISAVSWPKRCLSKPSCRECCRRAPGRCRFGWKSGRRTH